MSIQLPKLIANYFEADRNSDANDVANCFTDDGIVRDEGHTYVGHDAIRQWKADASTKYNYTVEPFALDEEANLVVVTSHVVGNFPGSPADLRYHFELADDGIAALEVKL